MTCPKCGTEFTGAFCPNCGTRTEEILKKQKIRVRKDYKTSVYVILTFCVDVLFLGIADFYAGYIKMGVVKCVLSVTGFVLAISTSGLGWFALPAVSLLISFFELVRAGKLLYWLENGESVVFVRPLDLIYDRAGTDNMLIAQYGCTVTGRRKG